ARATRLQGGFRHLPAAGGQGGAGRCGLRPGRHGDRRRWRSAGRSRRAQGDAAAPPGRPADAVPGGRFRPPLLDGRPARGVRRPRSGRDVRDGSVQLDAGGDAGGAPGDGPQSAAGPAAAGRPAPPGGGRRRGRRPADGIGGLRWRPGRPARRPPRRRYGR
ncbi:MAG: hypothetical protein AVDCRST_MAG59-1168, partial [uncultured Thermomicrobiales bacterium]